MYALCIGGIICVALMPLFKGTLFKGTTARVIDLQSQTSWGKSATIEHDIQHAKDKALFDGIYPL